MSEPTQTTELVRAAISNAYYDARNNGRTMEQAADDAATAVERIVAERRSADMARALRGQRDFFRAIDMTVAADHCEQAALAWESQAVTDALRAKEADRG